MLWLGLMSLPDGSRVESSLLSVEAATIDLAARTYRLVRPDGVVHEFATLPSILRHLGDHFDAEDRQRRRLQRQPGRRPGRGARLGERALIAEALAR